MNLKNVYYIAEISLPAKSAYSIHAMKMCNEIAKKNINTSLNVFNKKEKLNYFEYYNCKKKFKINSHNIKKNNFLGRIFFSYKLVRLFIPKNNTLIISRSIISAILLNFFNNKVILELHHELTGFTKYIFLFYKNFPSFKNLKLIFITKNLSKYYNLKKNKSIILDDGVDIENYNFKNRNDTFTNSCAYTGSFAKGKGIENIINISKYNQKIFFHLYGDFANSNYSRNSFKKFKNIKYKGHIKYKNIPKVLSKYNILLLPYSKEVFVRSKSIETSKYMSPMKLFDYMASKKIIIASKMLVYNHILNNKNSILITPENPKLWAKKIDYVLKNLVKFKNLRKNAFFKVKNYTWEKRVNKIIKFANMS